MPYATAAVKLDDVCKVVHEASNDWINQNTDLYDPERWTKPKPWRDLPPHVLDHYRASVRAVLNYLGIAFKEQ